MKIKYWDESKLGNIETLSDHRSIKIGGFENCIIDGKSLTYPDPLVRSGSELLLPTIERFMSLGINSVYDETMEYNVSNPRTRVLKENNPVFYFVYNCANYFHWLYDTIPYLYSFFEIKKKIPNIKLLMSPPRGENDLYPFVYETLELLGINKDDIFSLRDDTVYSKLYIGSSLTHNRMSLESPHPALHDLINSMNGSDSDLEKIYVSRRTWTKEKNKNIGTDYTQERMCVNEDEVVDLFEEIGFKEVFCEDLSMKDKIGMFRNAKVVAGPIGGGMSNCLFCSKSTKVLSINSPDFFLINKRLGHTLSHTDLYMFDETEYVDKRKEIINNNALSVSGGLNSQWKVNINSLKFIIKNDLMIK